MGEEIKIILCVFIIRDNKNYYVAVKRIQIVHFVLLFVLQVDLHFQLCWYLLASLALVTAYSPRDQCTDKVPLNTRDCKRLKLWKLEAGKYPVNSNIFIALHINNADLKEIEYDAFHSMNKLEYIDLQNNLIEHLDYRCFETLRNLRYLYLSRNKLHRISDGRLLQSQHYLVTLDLSLNRLAFLNSSVLAATVSLDNLNLTGNPFDCNCELWKTIKWCRNNLPEVKATCETPNKIPWSRINVQNKCPFANTPTNTNRILLIVCVVFGVVFVVVCVALSLVIFYCRNRRKSSHKMNVNKKRDKANDQVTDSTRKSYLSVIPEGTECSSRFPSSCDLDMDTGSIVFEELDEIQLAMYEPNNKAIYVNFPPHQDSLGENTYLPTVVVTHENSSNS